MSIRVENLQRTFGNFRALRNVNLEIGENQLIAILGPSGSGKTTLLRILGGLDYPDRGSKGRVFLNEQEVTWTAAADRKVGFVFQH